MKLVDILARELKGWPYDYSVSVSQDCDKDIAAFEYGGQKLDSIGYWVGDSYVPGSLRKLSTLAEDRDTAIVTHSEWQAAVDALGIPKFPGDAVEWDGEGLPPVGAMCEHEGSDGWSNPFKVEVIAHKPFFGHEDGGLLVVFVTDSDVSFSSAECFRPIRTPEQIAAEERKRIEEEIQRICTEGENSGVPFFVALYEAGYRKQEQE